MDQLRLFELKPAEKTKEITSFNVTVKSDIYKFIHWKEKIPFGEVIPLNKRYSVIMDILKNNITKNKHIPGHPDLLDGYDKMIKIDGHIQGAPYHRFLYSPTSIRGFNTMIYKIMMDCLFQKIELNLIIGKPERKTILEFMNEVQLEDEDIGYDSLLKSSQRYRQEMGLGTIEEIKQNLLNKKVSFS